MSDAMAWAWKFGRKHLMTYQKWYENVMWLFCTWQGILA
jgi:hypothetical protein